MENRYEILLPYSWTKDRLYTYESKHELQIGNFVEVSVKTKKIIGIIMAKTSDYHGDVKEIISILKYKSKDKFLNYKLNNEFLNWMNLVSKYTLIPMHQVLKMVMTSYKNQKSGYIDCKIDINKLKSGKYPLEMFKLHWNKLKQIMKDANAYEVDFPHSNIPINIDFFSEDQKVAIDYIQNEKSFDKSIIESYYRTILLKGQTGSGKTDVYFEMLYKVWKKNKQVLILVPEISLIYQFINRFYERFKVYPYKWHNRCKQPVWNWAISGKPGVIIGVRSALWLPFTNLGMIIVDEEHSTTYKQESGSRYNAKDIAILKAKSENIPIVLVSATPSLETIENINNGKYELIELTRTIKHKLNIQIVKTSKWLSKELNNLITETLKKGEQIMLFLNKRGFATHIYCSTCNNRLLCTACTAGLIIHKNKYTHCSYCAKRSALPKKCSECHSENSWKYYGLGIEKIHEQIKLLFPEYSIALLSSDNAETVDKTIEKIEKKEIDIIIGTQILAQGCHFPNLTLVAIIQGDVGMHSGDIRNTERMYQLISQVKGRCGRADKPGKVIIQTTDDNHPLLQSIAQNNTQAWVKQELFMRRSHNLPPFSKIIRVIFSSKNAELIEKFVTNINKPNIVNCMIMGPAPAQLYKYNHEYRWSFLFQYRKNTLPQNEIKAWINNLNLPKSIKIIIDVDPQSFF